MAIQRRLRRSWGFRKAARRGSALILTVFSMFVLFCCLAFSIDTGYLAGAKAEMRRSADAGSLAGCWELYHQMQGGVSPLNAQPAARQVSAQYVLANRVANKDMSIDTDEQSQDVRVGYLPSLHSDSDLSQNADLPFLAVQVSLAIRPGRW